MGRFWRYLAMLGRLWLVAAVTVVAVGAAAAYTYVQQPVYRASMILVVGQGTSFFQPDSANATEPFTQTMAALLKSDLVASRVVERLQLQRSSATLQKNLTVTTQPLAAVLNVSYDDTDRERGVRVLAEVGQVFSQLVQDHLGSSTAEPGKPGVSVVVFDPPHTVPGMVRPKPILYLGVASVLGIALGSIATLFRAQLSRGGAQPIRLEARLR
jgi:capsular polysaccharide biosynthesis protein